MKIERIKLKNFKSYKELDLELGQINVLIGANASGKSNLVRLFRFMKSIAEVGLQEAVYLEEGYTRLKNSFSGVDDSVLIGIRFTRRYVRSYTKSQHLDSMKDLHYSYSDIDYMFSISANDKENVVINTEMIGLNGLFYVGELGETKNIIGYGNTIISKCGNKADVEYSFSPELSESEYKNYIEKLLEHPMGKDRLVRAIKESYKDTFLKTPYYFDVGFDWNKSFRKIPIFDIDPKRTKEAVPLRSPSKLLNDGSNLPVVMNEILNDSDMRRKFINILKNVLPLIDDLRINKLMDKLHVLEIKENFPGSDYFPASLISEGTINLLALIVILFFEKSEVVIIEEPERNVHPGLISTIMSMVKDASKHKQIIITTHSPEVVRNVDPNDVYLVSRNQEGSSQITKPADREDIKIFLEDEIGLDRLYVDGFLGG